MTSSNADLQARRDRAIPGGVSTLHPVFADRAHNAEIYDVEGRRFIDFATGIAVCNTGHGHPRIVEAVKTQLDRFSHVCFQVTPFEPYVELAEKINALAPGDSPKKTVFLTTGAEAVENAIKIARAHTGRRGVLAFQAGYHGRTFMAMSLTGRVVPYKAAFGPLPGDVYHARYPIAYHGTTVEDAKRSMEVVFTAEAQPSELAAIIIEPVLGEGGFYQAPPEFLGYLRELCDEHGILLIADEIQSGFARTGRMFAIEHAGVEPDLMTMAKALAGGFPISGVVGKAEIMDAAPAGGLGGTYAGSPLGCAAGLEVLKIIEEDDLCSRAKLIGKRIKERLVAARDSGLDCIGEVRGPGAMVAVELVRGGDPEQPDPELTRAIVRAAADEGLILLACGVRGNVIRFLPALTAPEAILAEAMNILVPLMERLHRA